MLSGLVIQIIEFELIVRQRDIIYKLRDRGHGSSITFQAFECIPQQFHLRYFQFPGT